MYPRDEFSSSDKGNRKFRINSKRTGKQSARTVVKIILENKDRFYTLLYINRVTLKKYYINKSQRKKEVHTYLGQGIEARVISVPTSACINNSNEAVLYGRAQLSKIRSFRRK